LRQRPCDLPDRYDISHASEGNRHRSWLAQLHDSRVSMRVWGVVVARGKSNKLAEGEIKFRVRVVHLMLEDAKKRAEEQVAQLKAIDEVTRRLKHSRRLQILS
jgi:hypothetical protein